MLIVARDEERLREAARRLDGEGDGSAGTTATLPLDITDPDAGERMLAGALDRLGRVDVLVNNAGTARWRDLFDVPDEDWRAQYEFNVMAPLRAMKAPDRPGRSTAAPSR